MKYLLDTCAISEPIRKKPDPGLMAWLKRQHESNLFLSVLTLGELHKGVNKLNNDIPKKSVLYQWISQDLYNRFEGRIIDFDSDSAATWGQLLGENEKKGRIIPVVDAMIAATALVYDLIIVTRNDKDIKYCNVAVENPWHT